MNESQADQIADLLNKQNMLAETFSAADILKDQEKIIFETAGDTVIGSVQVNLVQWYQAEIVHLTVNPDYQRKGWGRRLLAEAEIMAAKAGALVAQCTTRDNNVASINLNLSAGYRHTATFDNPRSGNRVRVFQKPVGRRL